MALSTLTVTQARHGDLDALVALAATHGHSRTIMRRALETDLSRDDRLTLAGWVDDELVAYGRAARFEPDVDALPDVAPPGYYLGGLLVAENWRRQGIAERLTRARMAWAFEHAPEVWYFTNAQNTASLALHAKVGFSEVTRAFSYPNISFEGGAGVLARARVPLV